MRLDELFVIHIEFLDRIASFPCQYLAGHDIFAEEIVTAQLEIGVEDASYLLAGRNVVDYNFSLDKRNLDIELSNLCNFCNQVAHLYINIDFDHYMHRLVIIHVIIALCELCEMLSITI